MGLGVTRPPLIDSINGISFWHLTNSIVAFNHNTNRIEWTKIIEQVSLVSRPVFFLDKIIYPTEANFFLVLNKFSGNIVDTIPKTPSFPGRISSTEDKLFFIGGVDGQLYSMGKRQEGAEKSNIDLARFSTIYEGSLNHQFLITDEIFVKNNGRQWIISDIKNLSKLNLISPKQLN